MNGGADVVLTISLALVVLPIVFVLIDIYSFVETIAMPKSPASAQ
jgi:hypothetical protein